MTEQLYAGWDGGGTKTRVCIVDGAGEEKAVLDFGPLNPNGAEEAVVRESISACVRAMAGLAPLEAYGGLTVGMAGVSNRHAAGMVEETIRSAGYAGPLKLVGDQEIALAGAIDGHGAVLIAGTGSVLFGRTKTGEPIRVGGYGYLIDDGGSGYMVGREILTSLVRSEDGRGADTCLRQMVYAHLGMKELGEIISWLYAKSTGKKEIASLARLLPEALERLDGEALRIAGKASGELSEMALTAWTRHGMQDGELALTGSILEHMDPIREAVIRSVHAVYPAIEIGRPKADPAHGAASLAKLIPPGQSR